MQRVFHGGLIVLLVGLFFGGIVAAIVGFSKAVHNSPKDIVVSNLGYDLGDNFEIIKDEQKMVDAVTHIIIKLPEEEFYKMLERFTDKEIKDNIVTVIDNSETSNEDSYSKTLLLNINDCTIIYDYHSF